MNRDDLFVNFLPEEYLPKPEWRSFPLVALMVLLAVGLGIFLNWSQLDSQRSQVKDQIAHLETVKTQEMKKAAEFLPLQAKARVVTSYMQNVFALRWANPPWHEVYNRVEELLPEGIWITNFRFTGSKKGWPGLSLSVVSAGTSYAPLYKLHVNLLRDREHFANVRTNGYTVAVVQGQEVLTSTFTCNLVKSIPEVAK